MHLAGNGQLALELRVGGELFVDLGALGLGQVSLDVIEKLFRVHARAKTVTPAESACNREPSLVPKPIGLPFSLVEIS
jgi:hypothetical protein